jgi:hypothetical protein
MGIAKRNRSDKDHRVVWMISMVVMVMIAMSMIPGVM